MPEITQALVGKNILSKGTNVNVRALPGTTAASIIKLPKDATIVGKYNNTVGESGTQYNWYLIDLAPSLGVAAKNGYIRSDVAQYNADDLSDQDKATLMMQETLKNNIAVYNNCNNILIKAKALKAQGKDVSQYANQVASLLNNLQARQAFITNHPDYFKITNSSTAPTSAPVTKYTDPLSLTGLGIAPVVVAIIWGVVILVALYEIDQLIKDLGPHYDQSKADYTVSNNAAAAIAKLSPADQKIVNQAIKDTADKNLKAGIDSAGGLTKQIAYGALAVGGAILAVKLLPAGK